MLKVNLASRQINMINTPPMQVFKKLLVITLLLFSARAHAVTYPSPTGYINDFAGILDQTTAAQLNNITTKFERTTGNEVVVATIPSLENEPAENYAVELYKRWGIGKKGRDNGILILIALNDRTARIEVGYGLEPYINDALAGRIIRDTMTPHFREGDFSAGILNGVIETISVISEKTRAEFDPIAAGAIDPAGLYHLQKDSTPAISKILKIIFLIFFILLFIKNPWAALFLMSSLGGGRGGSFRGGFGGGFSGFGGGLSGGGGATGRW